MTVLGVVMQKGGVGKTTTTRSLGVELGRLGAKVLLIDLDAQSNLTQAVGFDPTTISYRLASRGRSAIRPTPRACGTGAWGTSDVSGIARPSHRAGCRHPVTQHERDDEISRHDRQARTAARHAAA